MSKPRGGTSFGISSGDILILPERHPACRRREARSGSGTEREHLAGDGKGEGASGSNREAESPMRRRGADCLVVFFKDSATTEIYTLSLHDALPSTADA